MQRLDAIIVGGGPAGLAAALVLGRCRRAVLVIDAGTPRNAQVAASRGFFTRDGARPAELRDIGRKQARAYGAQFLDGTATSARAVPGGFEVIANGTTLSARGIVLATGLRDVLPDVPGMRDLLGRGIETCEVCGAYEHTGQALAAYGSDADAVRAALSLRQWSRHCALYTDGAALGGVATAQLARNDVRVESRRVAALWQAGDPPRLTGVELADGDALNCDALFVHAGTAQASPLVAQLGCRADADGAMVATRPRVYVTGDAAQRGHWISIAAAEGARSAAALHAELCAEDWR